MMRLLSYKVTYLIVAVAAVVAIYGTTRSIGESSMPTTMAKRIVAECATVQGDHGPCYETAVPALYPSMNMSQLFDVVRNIRTLDPSYQFCHVLAHKLGERAIASHPEDGSLRDYYARALYESGQVTEAVAALESIEEIDPDWPNLHLRMASWLIEAGRIDEAVPILQSAVAHGSAPDRAATMIFT